MYAVRERQLGTVAAWSSGAGEPALQACRDRHCALHRGRLPPWGRRFRRVPRSSAPIPGYRGRDHPW